MKLLAIDTATDWCSVAVWLDGAHAQLQHNAPRTHTGLILDMVDTLLEQHRLKGSELDAIAFGKGPGSFTGLRISCGVAQGLAFGFDRPLLPVSSLAAMALQATNEVPGHAVMIANDARMGEVYYGSYQLCTDSGILQTLHPEQLLAATALPTPDPEVLLAGNAWSLIEKLPVHGKPSSRILDIYHAQARFIAELAAQDTEMNQAIAAELAVPTYLRDQVIQNP